MMPIPYRRNLSATCGALTASRLQPPGISRSDREDDLQRKVEYRAKSWAGGRLLVFTSFRAVRHSFYQPGRLLPDRIQDLVRTSAPSTSGSTQRHSSFSRVSRCAHSRCAPTDCRATQSTTLTSHWRRIRTSPNDFVCSFGGKCSTRSTGRSSVLQTLARPVAPMEGLRILPMHHVPCSSA